MDLYSLFPYFIKLKDFEAKSPEELEGNLQRITYAMEQEYDITQQEIAELATLVDTDLCQREFLPYLSYILGRRIGSEFTETFQRWLIANYISYNKIKGTHLSTDKKYIWIRGIKYKLRELWKTIPYEIDDYSRELDYTHTIKSARVELYTEAVPGTPVYVPRETALPIFADVEDIKPIHVILRYDVTRISLQDTHTTVTDTLAGSKVIGSFDETHTIYDGPIVDPSDPPDPEDAVIPPPEIIEDCVSTCEASCQAFCETSCQTGCEITGCQVTCETYCQHACELVCQGGVCQAWACQAGTCQAGSCQISGCQAWACQAGSCQAGACQAGGGCQAWACQAGSCQAGCEADTPTQLYESYGEVQAAIRFIGTSWLRLLDKSFVSQEGAFKASFCGSFANIDTNDALVTVRLKIQGGASATPGISQGFGIIHPITGSVNWASVALHKTFSTAAGSQTIAVSAVCGASTGVYVNVDSSNREATILTIEDYACIDCQVYCETGCETWEESA